MPLQVLKNNFENLKKNQCLKRASEGIEYFWGEPEEIDKIIQTLLNTGTYTQEIYKNNKLCSWVSLQCI